MKMKRIELCLLGTPHIEHAGEPVHFDSRKTLALLAYLAITQRTHRRDSLASLLWPESGQQTGRSLLRGSLYSINKICDWDVMITDRETVALSPGPHIWVDVNQFRGLIDECKTHDHGAEEVCGACVTHLSRALALYRGAFLDGFTLNDSVGFDNWQLSQTEGLRYAMAFSFERLIAWLRQRHDLRGAIRYALRWQELERYSEESHRLLMDLYARTGRREAALHQYAACVKILREDLGVSPCKATAELHRKIREGTAPVDTTPEDRVVIKSSNLPQSSNSFIGRRAQRDRLREMLWNTRLLTLTGAGGCGKTRLALEVARREVRRFRDGVWLIELAFLSDPRLVARTTASVLGVIEQPGTDIGKTLEHYLQSKKLLLLLDNCEHLIDACTAITGSLLRKCPHLRVMATSREAFRIPGEITWRVPSLSLPAGDGGLPTASEILASEAVQLFVARARARMPSFHLNGGELTIVAQICRRLDGIPLAIELAAARTEMLAPEQMLSRLDEGFGFLINGSRTQFPRHRTLQATFDWSYDLLTQKEQALLRRISVFAGSWQLEAAEYVGADDVEEGVVARLAPVEVLDVLSHLVTKSMVQVETEHDPRRYRLLETIRQYGRRKLEEAGEFDRFSRHHTDWYVRHVSEIEPRLYGRITLVG